MKSELKKSPRKLTATRLETWATPGVPDVLLCDESGGFHFIELKATKGNAVEKTEEPFEWESVFQLIVPI
jgi:hypothetical protein